MYDLLLIQDLGKIRQQELIELGRQSAQTQRQSQRQPLRRQRTPMALLLLLNRTLGR
jgi:hypothetical protein